jgi:hypothetical protein
MAAWRRVTAILALSSGLLLAGCVFLAKLGLYEPPGKFSHRLHGKEQELECQNCHATAEKAAQAGMPRLKQCMLCHEGIDEEKPPERRISTIYGEAYQWSPRPVITGDVVFSHQLHAAEKKIACGDCHQGIETNTAVSDKVRVFKDDCLECHAREDKANDCSACHKEIRQDWKPETHSHNWKQFHGQAIQANTGKSENRCSLCHADSSCVSCHQDEPPRDHTNHWRQRGHGIAVSIDRTRCATCHRDDFCDRCHSEVSPRNHVGSWGSPRSRHCLTCHFPLKNESCFVCHKSDPSHLGLANPKPSDFHSPALNCRQCHGIGGVAPFPHPDNGDDCNVCHR